MWGWSEKSKDIRFLRFLISPFLRYRADIGFGGFRTVPMSPEWPTNTTGSINNISLNIFERWDTRGNKFPSNFLVGGASGTRYRLIWTEMQHRWGAWVGLDIHNVHPGTCYALPDHSVSNIFISRCQNARELTKMCISVFKNNETVVS